MAYSENEHPRVPAGQPGGGRWIVKSFDSYDETVADISALLEQSMDVGEYEEYGIRVEDLDQPGKAGDSLKPSRVWDNGEPTADVLDGTSVMGIKSSDPADVDKALQAMGLGERRDQGYFGKVIYLVGGDTGSHGEDVGERVLPNAKIVAVYTRDANAFAPIRRRL